jgi:CheY-like chemotaxis protein
LWPCDCDENQIGQVIDNIIINGKQAMPTGGTISISAVNVANGPGHPGNYIRISIKDQGIGMPKDILPKIFDPFFTTKTQGHGLGLATVYSIIQRHDGWVDVESNPGNGSIFHISLPALQKTQLPISHFRAVTHAGSGSILVMDDEEFMLEIVGSMLKEMGYSVYSAKDGREAIGLFTDAERSGNSFIVTILDLTIPGGMGGKETAKAMRTLNPHSIIVASSGYSEDPVISNPKDHGFTGSIIKPFRKKELTELLVRILELED